jgi:hypothetical protein
VIEDIARPTFRITLIFTMRSAMGIASLHPSYGLKFVAGQIGSNRLRRNSR